MEQPRGEVTRLLDELGRGVSGPEQAKIVELRFFGALSVDETAEALHISSGTVKRYWNSAKAWLYREMQKGINSDARPLAADSRYL